MLRDNPGFNRLLETVDNKDLSDSELALALRLALSDFNTTPPRTNNNFDNMPEILLLLGGVVMACIILGLGHTRNELNYVSGGVTVRVFDRTPHFQNWISTISARYENMKLNFKISNNVNALVSGAINVPSEYSSVSHILI